jgi:hypothetical protein
MLCISNREYLKQKNSYTDIMRKKEQKVNNEKKVKIYKQETVAAIPRNG